MRYVGEPFEGGLLLKFVHKRYLKAGVTNEWNYAYARHDNILFVQRMDTRHAMAHENWTCTLDLQRVTFGR